MFLKYNLTVIYFLIDAVQQRFAANNIFTIARRVVDGQVSSLFVDFLYLIPYLDLIPPRYLITSPLKINHCLL